MQALDSNPKPFSLLTSLKICLVRNLHYRDRSEKYLQPLVNKQLFGCNFSLIKIHSWDVFINKSNNPKALKMYLSKASACSSCWLADVFMLMTSELPSGPAVCKYNGVTAWPSGAIQAEFMQETWMYSSVTAQENHLGQRDEFTNLLQCHRKCGCFWKAVEKIWSKTKLRSHQNLMIARVTNLNYIPKNASCENVLKVKGKKHGLLFKFSQGMEPVCIEFSPSSCSCISWKTANS